ncbi:hypothetical protein FVER53590_04621 [Fusarium verticillioides]|nr:hypothetical protein FVER53590_04621 [Fusarium verticillioides]
MLTVKQPPTYGYKSVHDLPTPPSTSRPSPPLINREPASNSPPVAYRGHSPPSQPMSAPHRGLPPPAAMTLPPQQPPTAGAPPPTHLPPHPPPPPPPQASLGPSGHQQRDSWGQLPAPPQQWQGAEESMRHWLQARAEEDKRKQEEERTRQESLRLEQRKVEMDMLRTSLQAGIPPPMVPLVFAGMGSGGVAPQAALEWAQQFMPPGQAPPRAQIMPAQWSVSPEHQRESQTLSHTHAQHPGIPSASTPAAGPHTLLRCTHISIRICSNNSSKNPSRVLRYTFTTGSHQHHKLAEARTDPEVLLGKLLESAKQQGIMPLPPPAVSSDIGHLRLLVKAARRARLFVDRDVVIHVKEVTCHPSESSGRDGLAERVLADLYAECHRYAPPLPCPHKKDRATRTNSQSQLYCQRSHRPAHGIQGPIARAKSKITATSSHHLEIQSHIEASKKPQNCEKIQGKDKALDGSAP